MAKLTNLISKKYSIRGLGEDEAPEHGDTQGEQLIKDLVKKQTTTHTSLSEQLSLQQNFIPSTALLPLSQYGHGQSSLEKFSEQTRQLDLVENFKSRGLRNEEIQLALDLQRGEDYVREKHKVSESAAFDKRIADIKMKLSAESDTANTKLEKMGRHERELLLSVKPQSESTKLLHFAQNCQSSQSAMTYPLDHPMNQLPELEQQLFGHLMPQPRKRKRKHKAEGKNIVQSDCEAAATPVTLDTESVLSRPRRAGSQWDKKEPPPPAPRRPARPVDRVYSCPQQTWYTVKDNKPVFLGLKLPRAEAPCKEAKPTLGAAFVAPTSASLLIPLQEIQEKRLTNAQILDLPRFSNYEEGTLSKTLFVKNLAGSVKETDLVGVFGHFEDPERSSPRLVYRLMGGKMRGQAFITFPNTSLAEKALNAVNGFQLKGKPIIIQYGKHAETT